MGVKIVEISQCGIPNMEPVELSVTHQDEIEWDSKSGVDWEITFVRGPGGKKSPFGKEKFKLKERGKPEPSAPDGEYKYNITGTVMVRSSVKGQADRPLTVTVDPTVIIRP